MKKHLLTLICIMSINMVNAQIVNIPDAIFKDTLVNNPAINTNGDTEIQVTEAAAYTSGIFVSNMGIADMTGIEAFTAIDYLDCSSNSLTSLNVSTNTALYSLNCNSNQLTSLTLPVSTTLQELLCIDNQLTSLDVSANTALGELNCESNQLTSLNVTSDTDLYFLNCGFNQLTSLDVSTNTNLNFLLCGFNQLTSLNVSANTTLGALYCNSNFLTSLDVSANTNLGVLICRANQLTSLNVSTNTSIGSLLCDSNQITSLNLSADIFLDELWCQNNQLTSLNVQNGFNTNITDFNATNNPNLTCIQVDNVANANSYTGVTFFKDSAANYSTNCGVYCSSSQGANSGSVFVSVAGFNTVPWSQPQNAQSSDNSYASVGLSSFGPYSEGLKATGFGFSIPTTASICGIEVNVERSFSGSIPVNDFEIRVVKNDTATGLNYASNLSWSTTDSVVTYGSNSDLWGTTWTPAEINNSSFGAAVSAMKSGPFSSTAQVDQITINPDSALGKNTYVYGFNF